MCGVNGLDAIIFYLLGRIVVSECAVACRDQECVYRDNPRLCNKKLTRHHLCTSQIINRHKSEAADEGLSFVPGFYGYPPAWWRPFSCHKSSRIGDGKSVTILQREILA